MMGTPQRIEPKLFYSNFSLSDRIRTDHPLRAIAAKIDFGFVRSEVASLYGQVGNPSIDPAVLMKLMFILFYENVSSERALAQQLGERLDWMWFCGYDLDSELPNHSVLSKARRRWGKKVFAGLFERVVLQCVNEGLVDGTLVHVDGSVLTANASKDTLKVQLHVRGGQIYEKLEQALPPEPAPASSDEPPAGTKVSTTDSDARLICKNGQSILGYKDHRVVDDRCGIITATITTDATTPEANKLQEALELHERNTGLRAATVVGDKGYGTAQTYCQLKESGVTPCIPHKQPTEAAAGKFRRSEFHYDNQQDCYVCPARQQLHRRGPASDERWRYQCEPGVCNSCHLRTQCTATCRGRLLSRHVHQDAIDWADNCLGPGVRRRLMGRRKHCAEGSFADATNRHGYKRARWRGLEWMTVQNLLIAAAQNIRKLIRWRPQVPICAVQAPICAVTVRMRRLCNLIKSFFYSRQPMRVELSSGIASHWPD